MHVLSRVYPYAGTEKKVIQLLNNLDKNKFDPHLLSLTDFWGDPANYLSAHIKHFALHKQDGVQPSLVFKIRRLFKKHRIDIVHSHNWATLFHSVLAARLAGVPVIIHGEHGRETKEFESNWKRKVIQNFLYQQTDQVVVVAKDLKDIAVKQLGIAADKITYIPNGVDLEPFQQKRDTNVVKKKYGIPPDRHVIATIARLRPVKDIPTLIKAFKMVCENHKDLILVIAGSDTGDSENEKEIRQLIEKLDIKDKLCLTGHVDTVPELLSITDIYVNSSLSEGMSNTILEAMSIKIPVVASDVGGNPELVKDGVSGYLFPAQNEKMLAEKLAHLLNDSSLRQKMGRNAYNYIVKNHSFQTMISSNIQMYHSLIKFKGNPNHRSANG